MSRPPLKKHSRRRSVALALEITFAKIRGMFSKRKCDSVLVMVWVAFAANEAIPIVFINRKMISNKYLDILGENLLYDTPLIFVFKKLYFSTG